MLTQRTPYEQARDLALEGDYEAAREAYLPLSEDSADGELQSLITNDLGVLAAVDGDEESAREWLTKSLLVDEEFTTARENLRLLTELGQGQGQGHRESRNGAVDRVRIALISFLFNWPSTGGGIIHTVELARFLEAAGYDVRLIHPEYAGWQIGRVDSTCPFPTQAILFDERDWNLTSIQRRFRQAVDTFAPDHVIITDCWNFKPHLARAVEGYSYLLRMQALECLCPLNNLRLLFDGAGQVTQCDNTQLRSAARCRRCVSENESHSGGLHRAERALSRFGTRAYDEELRWALRNATSVLVLNSSAEQLLADFCEDVRVVTWGMDAARFPWPLPDEELPFTANGKTRLLFAGLTQEPIKGFEIVHEACRRVWQDRQDFELIATAEPAGRVDEFTRLVGWQSQDRLPACYRACDVTVVPTIAQDGLSRTAVETMASGRAVLGSRIGGLPDSITEGVTGLLAEPGNVEDWTEKIEWLLDHPAERTEMGRQGRRRFERDYVWERVIDEQYGPLLGDPVKACRSAK